MFEEYPENLYKKPRKYDWRKSNLKRKGRKVEIKKEEDGVRRLRVKRRFE